MTVAVIILSVYLASAFIGWGVYLFQEYNLDFINLLRFAFIYITLPIWVIYLLFSILFGLFGKLIEKIF
jgi:hypothetical protein